jgi:CspA family cold shock protein
MPSGTVKWFDPVKGYGFITPDDGAKDVFVHQSAVARSTFAHLREGQRVGYALEAPCCTDRPVCAGAVRPELPRLITPEPWWRKA